MGHVYIYICLTSDSHNDAHVNSYYMYACTTHMYKHVDIIGWVGHN
jgi:hypothetical protein